MALKKTCPHYGAVIGAFGSAFERHQTAENAARAEVLLSGQYHGPCRSPSTEGTRQLVAGEQVLIAARS